MEIIRQEYIKQLLKFKEQHYIKVITGIRRCGKSTILRQYKNVLINKYSVKEEQIIHFDFNDKLIAKLFTWEKLTKTIRRHAVDNACKKYYVFLDEIQEIKNFENCIITLFEDKKNNFDIVITGSNSKMFSDELGSLLTGRHIEIKVYPFSFSEYDTFFKINQIDDSSLDVEFSKFMQFGGMPILLESIDNNEVITTKLAKVFDDVLNKDIKARHSLRNTTEFKKIATFIFDNNGKQTSTLSITRSLRNLNKSKITEKTVDRYISRMVDANLIYRSDYYDVKGKRILETSGRYYAVDLGIRNINAKFNLDQGYSLENIVFLEFKRLGYNAYGLKLSTGAEIDFVVENKQKKNSIKYIQVTQKLTKGNINSEIGNLLTIKDSFEKIVISQNDASQIRENGVRIINLFDWLLGKETINV